MCLRLAVAAYCTIVHASVAEHSWLFWSVMLRAAEKTNGRLAMLGLAALLALEISQGHPLLTLS